METGRVSGCCVVKRPEWSCRQSQNPVASSYPMIVGRKISFTLIIPNFRSSLAGAAARGAIILDL
jgi:hypothetical protein